MLRIYKGKISIRGITTSVRQFSSLNPHSETETTDYSSTDSDGGSNVKNIIDPYKGQYTDFLKNVSVYEESNDDSLKAMYYLNMN